MAGMESYLLGAGSKPRAGALRMFKLNVSNKCDEFTVDANDCEKKRTGWMNAFNK
jgi:hypothetical protein